VLATSLTLTLRAYHILGVPHHAREIESHLGSHRVVEHRVTA